MRRRIKDRGLVQTNCQRLSTMFFGRQGTAVLLALLAGLMILSACGGGGSSSSPPQNTGPLSGNWQFTIAAPPDGSFLGAPSPACPPTPGTPPPICSGGFLLQNKGSVTGQVVYSISSPTQTNCNSGSAPVTGTINGQNVTLTAVAGPQTFTLTGTLSANGSTMMGTYTTTDGKGCGTAQTGLQWKATSLPPLSGAINGSFHSTGTAPLLNQDFLVSGFLTQGANIGASNATVTGTLNFQGYPCLDTASVNGQISGNSVILQIIATNGLNVGQIGAPPGSSGAPFPVAFESSAAGGFVLQGTQGYGISTKTCKGGNVPGDVGNVCLGLGNTTGCTQPILLSPASLTFPAQALGSSPTAQTLTLTNSDPSGSTLNGLQLTFQAQPGSTNFPVSDFNGLPNFTEQDTCATSPGATFSLGPQQSCTITVSFSPQQSCPWLPSTALGGVPPSQCPPFLTVPVTIPPALTGTITVTSPTSADDDTAFAVPVTGVGLSAIVPSTPELDFGAEALSETSPQQSVSFTNQGNSPVQILPALSTPPCGSPGQAVFLPRPLTAATVPGLQVVTGAISQAETTITYVCDSDLTSKQPNFRITADSCSGVLLAPQQSCSVAVTFAPQPETALIPALDYFLELDTLQCTSTTTSNCEIDSGRFPVELKANTPSPLRMSPGAGLDFGNQPVGLTTVPLTITLFNDPNDPNSQTINFTGNLVKGDYFETDNCGTSLAPGSSCTLNVTFKPKAVGFDQGSITITYTVGQTQIIYLRGTAQ
jgi:hypothetical protein